MMQVLAHGFLPKQDPLKHLGPAFQAWEELAIQLPKLLMTDQLAIKVEQLPAFAIEKLTGELAEERAMLLLSFIAHSYVWQDKIPKTQIPKALAKPWVALAKRLGRPPVLSYASYALYNWYRIDPERPIELGNIALLQNFLAGMDEEWFILIHVAIEAQAIPAIRALPVAQTAVQKNDNNLLLQSLTEIAQSLRQMCQTLERMPECCDPYIYYHRVRPYIHGWKNNPALANGMIYEDCYDNQAQFFRGETGAQSTIIPALDAVLGIFHQQDELRVYLQEMRDYMPPQHRAYLQSLEQNGAIRDYIKAQDPSSLPLRTVYNACIDDMVRFRSTHLRYASSYIQKQNEDSRANSIAVGTGGTPFMRYLRKHELETEDFKI
jgi:indoleamine 2,3-dioxygenase